MILSNLSQLGGAILLIVGAVLPVVNPLGDAPIFLRMTPGCDEATRALLAKLIALGRAITPLTLPMTIDAGVIAVAITVGAFYAQSFKHTMIQIFADVIGAAIIALFILLTYRYAHRVSGKIGHTGMMVVVRLSAFIMLCIGVSISWEGITSLLAEIGIHG